MRRAATRAPEGRKRLAALARRVAQAILAIPWGIADAQVESIAHLESASRQGQVHAMVRLAARYELGEGVVADFARANGLYCEAARRGDAEAQVRLGVIYGNGRGVARDDGVASALFDMAAKQGHEHAKRLLEYMVTQLQRYPSTKLPECLRADVALPLRLSRELAAPPLRVK